MDRVGSFLFNILEGGRSITWMASYVIVVMVLDTHLSVSYMFWFRRDVLKLVHMY